MSLNFTGLFLVIFMAEPTGLSLHNFKEPDGKTASPAKIEAGYTATPVACGWAGAVIEVTRSFGQEQ